VAAAVEVLEQVHVAPSSRVLLLGDGRLAQLIGQVLLLTGCDVTVSGHYRAKLDLLRARGARTVLADDLPDERWDVVVEATGSPQGATLAAQHCRPRGTVVLKSTLAAGAGLPVVPTVVDEITVVGSRCGDFGAALRLLAAGRVEVAPLISGVYPLARAREAFAFAGGREVLKVLLDCA
jgi:threonine dehydrogenase-like Zn-dependent dehydrogenase